MNATETIALKGSKERIQRIYALVASMNGDGGEPVEDITGEYLELWVRDRVRKAEFCERKGIDWSLME